MLASLIRTTFHSSAKEQEDKSSSKVAAPRSALSDKASSLFSCKDGLVILSNDNPHEKKLDLLLGGNTAEESQPGSSNTADSNEVQVDVTLRTQLGQAPALMLLLTVPDLSTQWTSEPKQISICVEIGVNGRISTVDSAGLLDPEISGDTDMQGIEDSTSGVQELHRKIARVLEISQDLGTLIEWVLRWLRQRSGSG